MSAASKQRKPFQFGLDLHSGVPVYRQIIDQVVGSIAASALAGGDQLPTVRQLVVDCAFVVCTTCAFLGVQFLWVLLGLGALGIGLAAVLCFVHSRIPKNVGLSLESHGANRRRSSRK